jgi:DNA-binding CsgD family transcriptional regulator
MQIWNFAEQPTAASQAGSAVANIVAAIGNDDFGERLLHAVNTVLPVGCWSVYHVGNCRPVMYLSGTHRRKDTTVGSWNAYLSGPHLSDRTRVLGDRRISAPTICHLTAEEIPSSVHRDKVYRQFDMIERLSVAEQDSADSVFAVNLYRYSDQNHFSDRELAAFEMLAQPLLAAVKRHLVLRPAKSPAPGNALSIAKLRETLRAHRSDLSERELDVCARILAGMTYEGIAADLDLKVPTVKTYRNRAFGRLGICFRSELSGYYLGIAN